MRAKIKEKKERALGVKLFLKGERCLSPKCAMTKRPYPPGIHGPKKRRRAFSEYKKQLQEKQKVQLTYGLNNRQMRNLFKTKKNQEEILAFLERRLDNVIFRLGLAISRSVARQMINHGHFLVNGKKINFPSYQVVPGDEIKIAPRSLEKKLFKELSLKLKNYQPPTWLLLDKKEIKGKIKEKPKDISFPFDLGLVVNYYSR